jgi:hypothetical protein
VKTAAHRRTRYAAMPPLLVVQRRRRRHRRLTATRQCDLERWKRASTRRPLGFHALLGQARYPPIGAGITRDYAGRLHNGTRSTKCVGRRPDTARCRERRRNDIREQRHE